MSLNEPKKPKPINQYAGVTSNPDVAEAQKAIGIKNVDSDNDMREINEWILNKRYEEQYKDDYWYQAQEDIAGDDYDDDWRPSSGQLDQINARAYDYQVQAETQSNNQMLIDIQEGFAAETQKQQDRMIKAQERQNRINNREAKQLFRKNKKETRRQTKKQNAIVAERDRVNQENMDKAAAAQQAMMEEMMNQPVYMPRQAALPTVQKPMPKQNPILPAPAAPSPMNIGPPPAPELTLANNKMAIVRTPKSTRARQRRATRGTSSLIN
jgi:hypothetical protein